MLVETFYYGFMMDTMNDQIRQAVKVELTKRKLKQYEFAEQISMSRQQFNEIITGKIGEVPKSWERIFEGLDWELMPIPKNKVIEVKRILVE